VVEEKIQSETITQQKEIQKQQTARTFRVVLL
jgi:hypothetical protein